MKNQKFKLDSILIFDLAGSGWLAQLEISGILKLDPEIKKNAKVGR